jgi:hypothetical protein
VLAGRTHLAEGKPEGEPSTAGQRGSSGSLVGRTSERIISCAWELYGSACGCRMHWSHARSLHEVRRADLAVSAAGRRSGVLP